MHLESTERVVAVEGTVVQHQPTEAFANQLMAATKSKYRYSPDAAVYLGGVMAFTPRRARAWSAYPGDATRLVFDRG